MRNDFRARSHPAYWAFIVHRVSGVLLSLFLPLHFWALAQALQGEASLESFLRWTEQPLVKVAEVGLVLLLAAHMAGGVRLLMIEFLAWREWQKSLIALASAISLAFGIAFMLGQALNWRTMAPGLNAPVPHPLYPFTFYMLTGVHAAHVVGGFIPLGITIVNARRRVYTSSKHEGLRLCRQYWDFLGVVWLILLATLWIAT